MDIGSELRTARQAQSRSIDDIASVTKISPRLLRAIESNTFEAVPRGPFMRGFLKAFAHEVGLDGDDLVRRFREEFDAPLPVPESKRAVLPADVPLDPNDASVGSSTSHLLQIAVIVIVAVAYLVSQRQPNRISRAGAAASDAVNAAAAPGPDGVNVAATARPPAPADVAVGTGGTRDTRAGRLAIEVRAEGACWVEAAVDGERAIARLMNAGERQAITATDGVVLRVGDPAAFTFAINGVPGRSLGRQGQPVTVRIDGANYRQFLAQ